MNWLLIGILDILNKLLALFLVVSSTIYGYYGHFGAYTVPIADPTDHVLATVLGFVIGIILAALVSGFLAAVITISREMTAIHEILVTRPPTETYP